MLGKSKVTQRMKRRSAIASGWLEKHKSDLAETSLSEPEIKSDSFIESPSKTQNLTPVKDACRSSLPDGNGKVNSKNEKTLNTPSTTNENFDDFSESEINSRPLEKSVSPPSQNVNRSGKKSCTKKTTGGISNSTITKEDGHIDGKSNRHQSSKVPSLDNSTSPSMLETNETESEFRSTDVDSVSVDKISSQETLRGVSATKRKRSASDDANKPTNKAVEAFEEDVGKKPSKIRRTTFNESDAAETSKEEETPKKRTQKRWVGLALVTTTTSGFFL